MVHKKYTYKDGKKFGPYFYETKRVDGKIVTTYLGRESDKKKNLFLPYVLACIFLVLLLVFLFNFNFSRNLTGKVFLDFEEVSFIPGEVVNGNLKIFLREGEFIPADVKVLTRLGGEEKEFILKDLIEADSAQGNFYLQGYDFVGVSGEGFGFIGKVFPEGVVTFELEFFDYSSDSGDGLNDENSLVGIIYPDSSQNDSEDEENFGVDFPEEENSEINDAINGESESYQLDSDSSSQESSSSGSDSSSSSNSQSDSSGSASESSSSKGSSSSITGAIISEFEGKIEGVIKDGKSFIYNLPNGKRARIVEGSVKLNDEFVADDFLEISFLDNRAIISLSNYSEGFGEEFLGEERFFEVELSKLDFVAEENSNFYFGLFYGDDLLYEFEKDLLIEEEKPKEDVEVYVETIQGEAVLGEPVKWTKRIEATDSTSLIIELPNQASDIVIKKGSENVEELNPEREIAEEFDNGSESNLGEDVREVKNRGKSEFGKEKSTDKRLRIGLTGNVVFDEEPSRFSKFLKFTGFSVSEETEINEISLELGKDEFAEIEYYTPAPYSTEEVLKKGKRIVISSPEDLHYENVLSFTELSADLKLKDSRKIKILWVENSSEIEIRNISDNDGDGFYDYIEWVAPHLSNQTFDIIYITTAEHLDENREFVSDVFEEARWLDGVYTETIPDGHFVRVTFERKLNNQKDITVYLRIVSGNPRIEIYEFDGEEIIAEFSELFEGRANKVYLSALNGEQDVFDLKVLDGEVEFDYIVDPIGINVQRGVETMTALQLNVTINQVDPEKSLILLSTRSSSNSPNILHVTGTFSDRTILTLDKFSTSSTTVEWEVIENQDFYVQRGEVSLGAADFTATADFVQVSTNRSFIVVYGRMNESSNTTHPRDFYTGIFTNSTRITLERGARSTAAIASWQVVEWIDAEVQNGSTSASTTATANINSVNLSKSFVLVTRRATGSNTIDSMARVSFVNETQLAVYRNGSNGTTTVNWFVISHPHIYVQRGYSSFSASTPQNETLSSINDSAAFSLSAESSNTTSTNYGQVFMTRKLNSTALQLQKGAATTTINSSWFVVEFSLKPDTTNPTSNLVSPSNASYSLSGVVNFTGNFSDAITDNNGLANATLHIWNSTGSLINQTTSNISGISNSTTISVNLPYSDIYSWNYQVCDVSGNCAFNSSNYTYYFDTLSPQISFVFPTPNNNENLSTDVIFVNVSSSDWLNHYVVTDFDKSLLVWYRMDDFSGSTVIDSSSYSRNGTKGTNVFLNESGAFGNASYYPRLNTYTDLISIPSGSYANITNRNTTISFWMKSNSVQQGGIIVAKFGGDNLRTWTIGRGDGSSGQLSLYLANNSATTTITLTNSSMSDETWKHIVVDIDDTGSTTSIKSYVDGNLHRTESASIIGNKYDGTDVNIGGWLEWGEYNGSVDEFMMFNRSLNLQEIKSLYNAGVNQYYSNFSGLDYSTSYSFISYAVDSLGNKNQTEERIANIFGIHSCGVISSPGEYKIVQDLTSTETCINITANNVTIDGQGYTITYGNQNSTGTYYGIVSTANYTNIKNVTVTRGLASINTQNRYGIEFLNVQYGSIEFVNATTNYFGIRLTSSLNNSLTNISINNIVFSGILLNDSSNYNVITNVSGVSGGYHGIHLISSSYNQVRDVSLSTNSIPIRFSSSSNYNNYSNILSHSNFRIGFVFEQSSSHNIISNFETRSNAENGISLFTSASNNSFINGIINLSTEDAVNYAGAAAQNNYFQNVSIYNTGANYYDFNFAVAGLNGTILVDMPNIKNYSFTGYGSTVTFRKTGVGEIKFIQPINGSGTNLTRDVFIEENLAEVRSDLNSGLNKSANVTLYGLSGGLNYPKILRDGVTCPSNVCHNFTNLNSADVIFNVSHWTNYSIGESYVLYSCENLFVPNIKFTLGRNLNNTDFFASGCINITANNVELDCNNYHIINTTLAKPGIYSNATNTTIRNCIVSVSNTTGGYGIFLNASHNSTLINNSLSLLNQGARLLNTNYVNLINNSISQSNIGIFLSNTSHSNFSGNSITSTSGNGASGIYLTDSNYNRIEDNNAASSNAGDGIFLTTSSNNLIDRNNLSFNAEDGLHLSASEQNIITNNYFDDNSVKGLHLSDGSESNLIKDNVFSGNLQSIYFDNQIRYNNVTGNNITSSIEESIYLNHAMNNSFSKGYINNSGKSVIYITHSGSDYNNFSNLAIYNSPLNYYSLEIATAGVDGTLFESVTGMTNYSIAGAGGTLTVRNVNGEIDFFQAVNGSGTNFTRDIFIGNNLAEVRTDLNSGLNKSANVTLDRGEIYPGLINPQILRNGVNCPSTICYNFTIIGEQINKFNVSYWTNYTIGESTNSPPNNPTITINSSFGTNRTLDNLNCYATITDFDGDNMNVSVRWYKNNSLNRTDSFDNNYANGTLFNAILGFGNTTKGDIWKCEMRLFDGTAYSAWVNSSNLTILNSLPVVFPFGTLGDEPPDFTTTDRTPTFNWTVTDDDNDVTTSSINVSLVAVSSCADSDRIAQGLSTLSYTPTQDLNCLIDNGDYYSWQVRANDSEGYGSWASRTIGIMSLIEITLLNNTMNFGNIGYLQSNDTTDDNPEPFKIKNQGNSLVNITIEGSSLWDSVSNPSPYFMFKADNRTNSSSFNFAISATSFGDVPLAGSPEFCIAELNYSSTNNIVDLDIYIEVPPNEPPSAKNSNVTLTASLAE